MTEWQDIETAPRDGTDDPDAPMILLGCFLRGRLLWAISARYSTANYGYVQCASRSGWAADYMPPMAADSQRPRHPGEWIMGKDELAPTHWMPLPEPPKPDDANV